MTDREAMQKALDCMEWHLAAGAYGHDIEGTAGMLRTLLAEPVQEPAAHKHEWFRTGEMQPGEMRCISCGKWETTHHAPDDTALLRQALKALEFGGLLTKQQAITALRKRLGEGS